MYNELEILSDLKKIKVKFTYKKVITCEKNLFKLKEKNLLNTWLVISPAPWSAPKITNSHEGPCHSPAIKNTSIVETIDLKKFKFLKDFSNGV